MSNYFANYPKINYNINKDFPITTTTAVNILNRIKIKDFIKTNLVSYYPYIIKDFERPDTISYDYYGTTIMTWLILLANDIVDPVYEWPLFGKSLDNYIVSKYGSLEDSRINVHHYEKILRPSTEIMTEDGILRKINEKTVIIDEETYNTTDINERRVVSNFDYEILENEKKRNILLIDRRYSLQIQQELRTLY